MKSVRNRALGRIVQGCFSSASTTHPDHFQVPAERVSSLAKRVAGHLGVRLSMAASEGRPCRRGELLQAFDLGVAQARKAHPEIQIRDIRSFRKRVIGQVMADQLRLARYIAN